MNTHHLFLTTVVYLLSQHTAASVEFNQDIRPILSDKCFHCHGPDSADRKADLRLDTAEGLLTDLGGYFAVVPGKPEKSEVYKRIIHKDPEERMPPIKSHKVLSEDEKQRIYDWIKEGAHWQGHWAFEAITKPKLPKVNNKNWPQTPIDHFILARLEKEDISPSSLASKERLIRRLSLDLTGLPPTYMQVQQYLNNNSKDAYENLVDKLLASPAFGEHQAHYWLDAARYADTHGLHLDNFRSIWPYRDWVVDSFNSNKPFDQFTIEQLAGDLLPNPNQAQLIATGFSRSNPTTSEGGAINEEYEAIYAKDRTDTVSTVWMGLTTGCAACHDHKFDPVSQKEFYQLTAFFRNTTENAMDGNIFDTPPSIPVLTKEDIVVKQKIDRNKVQIDKKMDSLIQSHQHSVNQWVGNLSKGAFLPVFKHELAFHLPANEGKGKKVTAYTKGKGFSATIEGKYKWTEGKVGKALAINRSSIVRLADVASYNYKDRFSISLWVKVPKEPLQEQTLVSRIDVDGAWSENKNMTSGWFLEVRNNTALKLTMSFADQTKEKSKVILHGEAPKALTPETWHHVTVEYDGNATQSSFQFYVDGVRQNNTAATSLTPSKYVSINPGKIKSPLAIGLIKNPYSHEEKRTDKKVMKVYNSAAFVAIQDVRVYNNVLSEFDVKLLAKLPEIRSLSSNSSLTNTLNNTQKKLLSAYYVSQTLQEGIALSKQKIKLKTQTLKLKHGKPVTLVMQERSDSKPFAHVLDRGLYDQKKEKVDSAVPAFLPPITKKEHLNRLDLAKWLVQDDHPLTARVTINRIWQSIFGRGLVETAGDFGSQGSPPSHPKLLDWLAHDFKTNGWDMKRMIKQMVMSTTYKQSSILKKELLKRDSQNILLARASRPRLDAEVIRDQALHVSGLLVDKIGGAPVKPYQPIGLWKAVAYVDSNTMTFEQDSGEKLYRKSLYTFRKRTASPPGMSLFDAPDRESCVVQREQTNTPLQALLLMNDPQFLEAARVMAERVMKVSTDSQFDYLIQHALGRVPDKDMVFKLKNTFNRIFTLYKEDKTAANNLVAVGESPVDSRLDKTELAAWTMLVSQVFNLDEFITRN